jgi:diacylglycerol kinase (ATP)
MNAKKISVLINAKAGSSTVSTTEKLKKSFESLINYEIKCVVTGGVDTFADSFFRLMNEQSDGLVVCGGDGTINLALQYIAGVDIPLALMPSGTANDLATHIGYKNDINSLESTLTSRQIDKMDLISINDHLFSTVGGIGTGAEICRIYNSMRENSAFFRLLSRMLGPLSYLLIVFFYLVSGKAKPFLLEVEADGRKYDVESPCIFVCNQDKLGKDLMIAPTAKNNDGYLDVLIVTAKTPFELIKTLLALRSGLEPKAAERFFGKKISIKSRDQGGFPIFCDGENLGETSLANFEVRPAALHILRPN